MYVYRVALSRVRGLKPIGIEIEGAGEGRTLTSAWIETFSSSNGSVVFIVALSRVRGLKLPVLFNRLLNDVSHSHECVD